MQVVKTIPRFIPVYGLFLPRPRAVTIHAAGISAALLICLYVLPAAAQPIATQSVLKRPPVLLAQPLTIEDIETESSALAVSVAIPRELRVAQLPLQPALPDAESQASSSPPETVRRDYDAGIKPMSAIGIDIAPPVQRDRLGRPLPPPAEYARAFLREQPAFPRNPVPTGPWFSDDAYGPALNFCYRPLYFEEANLERYGRTAGVLQPLVSAGHFYGNAAILPYRLVAQRPGYCTYYDHPFRPGAPAPRERRDVQLRLDAATIQAAAVVGLIFLIP